MIFFRLTQKNMCYAVSIIHATNLKMFIIRCNRINLQNDKLKIYLYVNFIILYLANSFNNLFGIHFAHRIS